MWRRVLVYLVLGLHIACGDSGVATAQLSTPAPAGRGDRDQVARQELLDLEFFSEGRGLMMVPELIDVYAKLRQTPAGRKTINELLGDRWGFVINKDAPSGLFSRSYEGFNLGILGCATCHSGKAAGVFIPGLGNKNIDVFQIGRDVHRVEKLFTKLQLPKHHSQKYKEAKDFALRFAKIINVSEISNLTQGLVPVSIIQTWFYTQAGLAYPLTMNRGATKVPPLWGYGTKRLTGKYSDGFGDRPGWLVSIELTAGQKPETVRAYLPKVDKAEAIFADLLPPEYPFEKQCADTMPGKATFDATCAHCHGTYEKDEAGYPVYKQPKFVAIDTVRTDADRTDSITPTFIKLVEANPLSDVMYHNQLGRGYISPRLHGIWARFPYLHNGSVPSLRAMLTDPAQRPNYFSLKNAGEEARFDRKNVGLKFPAKGSNDYLKLEASAKMGVRSVYSTKRVGQSNQGHPFGTNLSDADKDALIEYLKCL